MPDRAVVDTCFVIGPIGDQLAEQGSEQRLAYEESVDIFENVIQAACQEFGITAYRADDIDKPGEIPEQVFQALLDEQLVIADLTGANPNVMYELGLRHTVNKVSIQIGEKGRLPFDINTIRTIQFKRSPSGLIVARKALAKAIGTTLAQGFDQPTATRLWQSGQPSAPSSGPASSSVLAADPDGDSDELPGFLELLADSEEALPAFSEKLDLLNQLTVEMGAVADLYAPKLSGADTSAKKLSALHLFANDLEPLVKQYDQVTVEADNQSRLVEGGLLHLLKTLSEDEDQAIENREFLLSVSGMGKTALDVKEDSLPALYDSTESLLHASAKLRPIVRLLRTAIERVSQTFGRSVEWGCRADEVLDRLPADAEPTTAAGGPSDPATPVSKKASAKKVSSKSPAAKTASSKKAPAKKVSSGRAAPKSRERGE
jgi:hypothetical protein